MPKDAAMTGFTQLSPAQLSRLIGTPAAPVLVDLRTDEDFAADPRLIPTAFRCAHDRLADLVPVLAGRNTVVYCQAGRKLSEGGAALLRSHGLDAESLDGGWQGWIA